MLEKQNFLPVGPWIRAEMSYKGTGLGGTLRQTGHLTCPSSEAKGIVSLCSSKLLEQVIYTCSTATLPPTHQPRSQRFGFWPSSSLKVTRDLPS